MATYDALNKRLLRLEEQAIEQGFDSEPQEPQVIFEIPALSDEYDPTSGMAREIDHAPYLARFYIPERIDA